VDFDNGGRKAGSSRRVQRNRRRGEIGNPKAGAQAGGDDRTQDDAAPTREDSCVSTATKACLERLTKAAATPLSAPARSSGNAAIGGNSQACATLANTPASQQLPSPRSSTPPLPQPSRKPPPPQQQQPAELQQRPDAHQSSIQPLCRSEIVALSAVFVPRAESGSMGVQEIANEPAERDSERGRGAYAMTTDHAHPQQLERVSSLRLEEQPYAAGHFGRDVRRKFAGYGVVSGKVVSYNPDWGLYGIKYENGDYEHLDKLKVQSVLLPHHENKDWTGAELALAAARRPFDEMGFAHEDDSQCSWAAQVGGAKAGGKCDKGPPSDLVATRSQSVLENVCCPAVQRSSLQCGSARSTYMIDSEREDSMPTPGSFRRVSSSPRCSASLQGNTAREAGQSADAIDQVRANSANENEVAQRDSREEEAAARSREAEAAMQEQEEEGRWSAEAAAAAVEGKRQPSRERKGHRSLMRRSRSRQRRVLSRWSSKSR